MTPHTTKAEKCIDLYFSALFLSSLHDNEPSGFSSPPSKHKKGSHF